MATDTNGEDGETHTDAQESLSPGNKPRVKHPRLSIAALGLNLMAAESGRVFDILPENYRACGGDYGLPADPSELYRLSLLPITRLDTSTRRYLIRARKAYKACVAQQRWKTIETQANEATGASRRFQSELSAQQKAAEEAVSGLKATIIAAEASLGDLYALAKKVDKKVIEKYLDGDEEAQKDALTAAQNIKIHVARLGRAAISEDQRGEATEAVFDEFVETQRRVKAAKASDGSGSVN